MYRRLILIFLSGGISTPEIRGIGRLAPILDCRLRIEGGGTDRQTADPESAIQFPQLFLPLLLLVLGVGADHAQDPLAANDLAVLTDASHTAAHFHDDIPYAPVQKPAN